MDDDDDIRTAHVSYSLFLLMRYQFSRIVLLSGYLDNIIIFVEYITVCFRHCRHRLEINSYLFPSVQFSNSPKPTTYQHHHNHGI